MLYQTINPNDGEVLKTFPELSEPELEGSVRHAKACFDTWRKTTYAESAAIVAKAAALLHARADTFARMATLEMGKRIDEARGEVEFSARIRQFVKQEARAGRVHTSAALIRPTAAPAVVGRRGGS